MVTQRSDRQFSTSRAQKCFPIVHRDLKHKPNNAEIFCGWTLCYASHSPHKNLLSPFFLCSVIPLFFFLRKMVAHVAK